MKKKQGKKKQKKSKKKGEKIDRKWLVFTAAGAFLAGIILSAAFLMLRPPVREVPVPEKEAPVIRPAEKEPVVALVLDDFGYTQKNLEGVRDIGAPVTLAVLPNTPYAGAVCSFARKNGIEVILHMPMEPRDRTISLEKDTLTTEMSPAEVRNIIDEAYAAVPGADGMSNHQGSGATADEQLMTVVLEDIKQRRQFFLDSMTTGRSVCGEVAGRLKVPCVKRDIFLDHEMDRESIRKQMAKLDSIARRKGRAVAIGHDREMTVSVLREVVPKMRENGIRFISLSEMVDKTEGR